MILIIGSTHDDVLYFESVMTRRREEKILDHFPAVFGNIFNQEVCLVEGVYSNYVSSMLTLELIHKYYVILVFAVGRCTALTRNWKLGDIAISRYTVTGDVDLMLECESRLGQIPGCPAYFVSQEDIVRYFSIQAERRINASFQHSTYVSMNSSYASRSQLDVMLSGDRAFGTNDNLVMDNALGGIAVACHFGHVPFLGVKVVSRFLDEPYTVEEYATTLRKYIDLGKAVVSTIGDIGRSDLLGGQE